MLPRQYIFYMVVRPFEHLIDKLMRTLHCLVSCFNEGFIRLIIIILYYKFDEVIQYQTYKYLIIMNTSR